MIVVCNSSPIIALASIKRLYILEKLFSEVIIPKAVYQEILEVINLYLNLGESEVIAYALENEIERVILDDKQARKIAEKQGLKVIGTLGILILAKEKGIIDEVKSLILQMRERINFRLSDDLINKVLLRLKELTI